MSQFSRGAHKQYYNQRDVVDGETLVHYSWRSVRFRRCNTLGLKRSEDFQYHKIRMAIGIYQRELSLGRNSCD